MLDYASEDPLIIANGDGVWLEDVDGNRYLDGFSSMWCNVHGHRVEEIDDAIRGQLDNIAHTTLLGLSNEPAIRLAEKLVEITPRGLDHVFFSDTGAAAVEIAVKMAFQYWQQRDDPRPEKTHFLHNTSSYHGDTVGAMSVGGIDLFHSAYQPLLFPSIAAPAPHPYRCSFCSEETECNKGCLAALREVLDRDADRIAAFIVEPLIQGPGGMFIHPEGYLKDAADLCREHDVLLIADEVMTGFGRTGSMFACEQEEVSPDLLCLGKGLTGGYLPVAATVTTGKIYDAFLGPYEDLKTFLHGHTFTGNPLGCAAALASIDKLERDDVLDRMRPLSQRLAEWLQPLGSMEHVGDVRCRGLVAAIELVANRQSRRPFPMAEKVGIRVCQEARRRGLLIRPLGSTIVLMPPLAIAEEELSRVVEITVESIKEVLST